MEISGRLKNYNSLNDKRLRWLTFYFGLKKGISFQKQQSAKIPRKVFFERKKLQRIETVSLE
ncbi:hypothetical protein DLM78_06550 [Leptospira stimsonii]|uniref:Uncharacterized protein n=1 Tax=Leptospira stimsonii TaxID=2202203 RepID=A0A396ZII5_9LEPT|nr:hypothetical protein DLM78_06550 [Leptospira stimsonii]RHX93000.1 hypothetical protein DLM75_07565 [Leptospira stimsonii]